MKINSENKNKASFFAGKPEQPKICQSFKTKYFEITDEVQDQEDTADIKDIHASL